MSKDSRKILLVCEDNREIKIKRSLLRPFQTLTDAIMTFDECMESSDNSEDTGCYKLPICVDRDVMMIILNMVVIVYNDFLPTNEILDEHDRQLKEIGNEINILEDDIRMGKKKYEDEFARLVKLETIREELNAVDYYISMSVPIISIDNVYYLKLKSYISDHNIDNTMLSKILNACNFLQFNHLVMLLCYHISQLIMDIKVNELADAFNPNYAGGGNS